VGLALLPLRRGTRYYLIVSSSSLSPDEIRAAAETHSELGKDYSGAVIESFLEKVGAEIDARVDARLNRFQAPAAPQAKLRRQSSSTALGILSLVLGIPITAIVAYSPAHLWGLLVVWLAIAVINIAHAASHAATNQPPDRN
jgi:hypothetical protein